MTSPALLTNSLGSDSSLSSSRLNMGLSKRAVLIVPERFGSAVAKRKLADFAIDASWDNHSNSSLQDL